jgi:hypothetical protein
MHAQGIGLQITRYYSALGKPETCTGVLVTDIREVPYILHLSRVLVVLDSIPVI